MSLAFRVHSRGDLVRGRASPAAPGAPRPLVIVCGPDGSADGALADACLTRWSAFAVVAAIDLPLCGARASDKLSQAVLEPESTLGRRLRGDLEEQAASDLECARRWLTERTDVDEARVALVGFGRGGELARGYCEGSSDLACWRIEADPGALGAVEAALREALGVA